MKDKKFNKKSKSRKDSYSNKGKRSNSRNSRYEKEASSGSDKEYTPGSADSNHPSWYMGSSTAPIAGKISFYNPMGLSQTVQTVTDDAHYSVTDALRIPGIMKVPFMPSVGYSDDAQSPINVSMRNLYAWVRHANSGSRNYEDPDLMCYIIAVGNAIMYFTWMSRVYGFARTYSQTNRYYPAHLLTAMGVDPVEISRNLPNFLFYINDFAYRLASLAIPGNMPYFARCAQVQSNVFIETTDTYKSQSYFMDAYAYLKWSGRTEETGTSLDPQIFNDRSYEGIVRMGDTLINAIRGDEDCGIISGDIKKAFGDGGLLQIPRVDENYALVPVYDHGMLMQIKNATCSAVPTNFDQYVLEDYQVIQVNGLLISKPTMYLTGVPITLRNAILNSDSNDPDPGEVMESTRLTLVSHENNDAEAPENQGGDVFASYDTVDCGIEIPLGVVIYTVNVHNQLETVRTPDGLGYGGKPNIPFNIGMTYRTNVAYQDIGPLMEMFGMLEPFRFAPYHKLYAREITDTSLPPFSTINNWGIVGKFDNVTVVPNVTMKQIHRAALNSLFNVPQMGSYIET